MNFKLKHANKLVAVFILIAILIIIATMVFTGDITELFSEKYYFTSIFKDTSGLSPGIPVKLIDLDLEIGKVDNVESNNVRGQVKVEYSVIRSYADRYLKKDSVVFYSEGVPIVGKANLLLTIGEETQSLIPLNKKNEPILKEIYIPSNQTREGEVILTKTFYKEEGEDPITSSINNINQLTTELASPEGSVFQTLANIEELTNPSRSELLRTTNKLISDIADLTEKLNRGDVRGLIGQPVYREILEILEEIKGTITDVRVTTLDIVNNETLASLNNMINEQNKNVSSLINESVKELIDRDIKILLNEQISPAIEEVTSSVDEVSTEVENLLYTVNGFVANTTTTLDDLVNRTSERVDVITEEVSDSILDTLQGVTGTIDELEETLLTEIVTLLEELTNTLSDNLNPAIGEITEDVVVSIDTITKGLTETVYELQLVIGEEAKTVVKSLSVKILNIIDTLDKISATAGDILEERAPEISDAIKSLSDTMKELPELIDNLNTVLNTADLTLRRVDLILEKLDSILANVSGEETLPIPGRTGQGSQRGDD